MGNIWGSGEIRPVNGTYLWDKPRQFTQKSKRRCLQEATQKPLEEPLLPAKEPGAPAPKEHWKVKALRIIHYVAERSRAFNRGMLLQTEG